MGLGCTAQQKRKRALRQWGEEGRDLHLIAKFEKGRKGHGATEKRKRRKRGDTVGKGGVKGRAPVLTIFFRFRGGKSASLLFRRKREAQGVNGKKGGVSWSRKVRKRKRLDSLRGGRGRDGRLCECVTGGGGICQ